MRSQRGLAFIAALSVMTGLAFAGWTHVAPAYAQGEAPAAAPPALPGGPASIAASGDSVYIVRGNTLYQFKAADLSLTSQKDLPAPGNKQ